MGKNTKTYLKELGIPLLGLVGLYFVQKYTTFQIVDQSILVGIFAAVVAAAGGIVRARIKKVIKELGVDE